jgi:hypothetical protein
MRRFAMGFIKLRSFAPGLFTVSNYYEADHRDIFWNDLTETFYFRIGFIRILT